MVDSKNKIAKIIFTLGAVLFMIGCGSNPTGTAEKQDEVQKDAVVKSDIVLGKVAALSKMSKSAAIDLRKVHFTLISSAADTVKDSATVSGRDQVILSRSWTLKSLRTWTLHAKSVDAKDSVIHQGSSKSFYVMPADTVSVNLGLSSRFTMYQARFNVLPDSIESSKGGTGKAKVNLNRLTLKVDGAVKADTLKHNGWFDANQVVNLFFDYMTPGSHAVVLEASGKINGYEGVLYRGTVDFNVAAGIDETRSITLGWVGPVNGGASQTVTLGRVGQVIIEGTLPGSVIP